LQIVGGRREIVFLGDPQDDKATRKQFAAKYKEMHRFARQFEGKPGCCSSEGYVKGKGAPPTPYRGYFFHALTRQGNDASGGAKSYVVNGKMTGGFTFVAYPAEYRSSGVMTFIVNQDGTVYQKELCKDTESLGKSMHEYNPDSTWTAQWPAP
jgi:hypothetical protein